MLTTQSRKKPDSNPARNGTLPASKRKLHRDLTAELNKLGLSHRFFSFAKDDLRFEGFIRQRTCRFVLTNTGQSGPKQVALFMHIEAAGMTSRRYLVGFPFDARDYGHAIGDLAPREYDALLGLVRTALATR
jgi:hypothetical protein